LGHPARDIVRNCFGRKGRVPPADRSRDGVNVHILAGHPENLFLEPLQGAAAFAEGEVAVEPNSTGATSSGPCELDPLFLALVWGIAGLQGVIVDGCYGSEVFGRLHLGKSLGQFAVDTRRVLCA